MVKSFLLGSISYPMLEILYRGRTHYSMAMAGGIGVCAILKISRTHHKMPVKILLCGTVITAIEFACGQIWNRNYKIWDYRNIPLNYKGQICLPYFFLWCGLSTVVLIWAKYSKRLVRF